MYNTNNDNRKKQEDNKLYEDGHLEYKVNLAGKRLTNKFSWQSLYCCEYLSNKDNIIDDTNKFPYFHKGIQSEYKHKLLKN